MNKRIFILVLLSLLSFSLFSHESKSCENNLNCPECTENTRCSKHNKHQNCNERRVNNGCRKNEVCDNLENCDTSLNLENGEIVKQFDSKVFDVHFVITEQEGFYTLTVTDNAKDHFEMRVFTSSLDEAFDFYFDIDATLVNYFIEERDDKEVMSLMKENPMFFVLISYYSRKHDWVFDKTTNNYYYAIDKRTECSDE